MTETLTTQGLDISNKMPDKMPGISNKIPDNQPNLVSPQYIGERVIQAPMTNQKN
jgi:hypothetical protein